MSKRLDSRKGDGCVPTTAFPAGGAHLVKAIQDLCAVATDFHNTTVNSTSYWQVTERLLVCLASFEKLYKGTNLVVAQIKSTKPDGDVYTPAQMFEILKTKVD